LLIGVILFLLSPRFPSIFSRELVLVGSSPLDGFAFLLFSSSPDRLSWSPNSPGPMNPFPFRSCTDISSPPFPFSCGSHIIPFFERTFFFPPREAPLSVVVAFFWELAFCFGLEGWADISFSRQFLAIFFRSIPQMVLSLRVIPHPCYVFYFRESVFWICRKGRPAFFFFLSSGALVLPLPIFYSHKLKTPVPLLFFFFQYSIPFSGSPKRTSYFFSLNKISSFLLIGCSS